MCALASEYHGRFVRWDTGFAGPWRAVVKRGKVGERCHGDGLRGVDSANHFVSDHEYCAPEIRVQMAGTRRVWNGHLGVDPYGHRAPPTSRAITRYCEYMVRRYNTAQHSARSDTDINNYTYPSLHQFSSCICIHCPACTVERDQTTFNSALRAGPLTATIFPAP